MNHEESFRRVNLIFILWLVAALVATAAGMFAAGPGQPSQALALHLLGVIVAFFVLMRLVPSLRRGVEALDPALLVGLQGWRILGMMFLFLMAMDQLPAVFAIPAGVGDVLVGLFAPFLAARLRDGKLSRRSLGWFTAFGIFDFVAAFSFGNYVNLHPETYAGYASMTSLPLVLVPAFFVPGFALLHLAAWTASNAKRRTSVTAAVTGSRRAEA